MKVKVISIVAVLVVAGLIVWFGFLHNPLSSTVNSSTSTTSSAASSTVGKDSSAMDIKPVDATDQSASSTSAGVKQSESSQSAAATAAASESASDGMNIPIVEFDTVEASAGTSEQGSATESPTEGGSGQEPAPEPSGGGSSQSDDNEASMMTDF